MLIFNQAKAHVVLAKLAKAHTGRDGNLGLGQQFFTNSSEPMAR